MKRKSVKMFQLAFAVFVVTLNPGLFAQETLTNETVLRLWRANVGETFIVERINQMPGVYQLGAGDLQTLTENRVPESIVTAMLTKKLQGNRPPATPPPAAPTPAPVGNTAAAPAGILRNAPAAPTNNPPAAAASDSGNGTVFYRRGNNWERAEPEMMTWQRRGAASKIAKYPSLGIVGRAVKAKLFGEHSRNNLTGIPDIVVAVRSGASLQNYLMVQLEQGKGERRLTVGDKRTNASHHSIPFSAQKIQTLGQFDQYRIDMPDGFAPGEYGVYDVASVFTGSQESARIYTFSIN